MRAKMGVKYTDLLEKTMLLNSIQFSDYKNVTERIIVYAIRTVNLLVLYTFLMQHIVHFYQVKTLDLEKDATNFINIVTYISAITRVTYYIVNRKQAGAILSNMKRTFLYEVETVESGVLNMDQYIKTADKVCMFWHINVIIATTVMSLVPLMIMVLKHTERLLPHNIWYPTDWKTSNFYALFYLQQIFSNYVMGFCYSNSDSFLFTTIILSNGQYEFLGLKLKNILFTTLKQCDLEGIEKLGDVHEIFANFDDHFVRGNGKLSAEIYAITETETFKTALRNELGDCIKMHQNLKDYSAKLNDFFSLFFLPLQVFAVFFLVFMTYGAVTVSAVPVLATLAIYSVTVIIEQLIVFLVGQLYINKTGDLLQYLYEVHWYLFDKSTMKAIHIMQTNMLKSECLTAGKLMILNLPTFITLMRSVFSCLTVLRQITANQ